MSDRPLESRTWDNPEEAERLLAEMREQIDQMKVRVRVYRAVLVGDEPPPKDPEG